MTQLEKVSSIVGLMVVGVGIFSYFFSLHGSVETIKTEQLEIASKVSGAEQDIMELKSHYYTIETNIQYSEKSISYLQNKIDNQQDKIEDLKVAIMREQAKVKASAADLYKLLESSISSQ